MAPPAPEKLIRDGIPALAAAEGRNLALRTASAEEMARFLGLKLVEETHEVLEAIGSGQAGRVLDELADLQTVIDTIARRHGLGHDDVMRRAEEKRAERGGFDGGLILIDPPDSAAAGRSATRAARLHTGGGSSLLNALKHEFQACAIARIAVAFVMDSGLDLIEGPVLAALLRGAELRILTTDYLGVTEPAALARICSWSGHWHDRLHARVYSHERRSFHPKAYLFQRADGSGRAFIGSANLSRMALTEGVEWTWTVLDVDAGYPMHELTTRFDELFCAEESRPLSIEWVREYEQRRVVQSSQLTTAGQESDLQPEYDENAPEPREVQKLALGELERLRQDGETHALVVAATGLGKTFLAAFDARDAQRVLFIAHREELLRQAEQAFARVYPERTRGWLADGRAEVDRDVVLASIQTLSRPEHLAHPELARFDYVVIDEFHHAAANSYQRVLQALSPRFLLGLTATPFRADQRDLLSLCHGNLAYQVGLLEAITFGWLVPFHYHGIADVVVYTDDLLTASKVYDTVRLTVRFNTRERADLVLRHYREHAGQAALGFCVSIDHADFMAQCFREAGVAAAAVHSGPNSMDRTEAVRQLAQGQLTILFTVDLFNEGVDIPAVDLVMFLRPTESMTIYLQQLGRGLRLHPGKDYLTVLDFIGNYRQAHLKLPLLVGQDLTQDQDAARALRVLTQWQETGVRPDGVPEGVEVTLEPVALSALRESLQQASPLRQLVLDDLQELAHQLKRAPTLAEWQAMSRYSLATARSALGVDRWHQVLAAADLASDEDHALDSIAGEFLKEIEKTGMSKSFKMVVLLAMCDGKTFRKSVHATDLVSAFRRYFSEERHRDDVAGTDVEEVMTVDDQTLLRYIDRNPIAAWIGRNAETPSKFFTWDEPTQQFQYIGPVPSTPEQERHFASAVFDRATARLNAYWQRPGAGRHVFPVIPAGGADDSKTKGRDRTVCIMFGDHRAGLPTGWHLVSINGRHLYGKFVAVALNVLKAQPSDARSEPNLLTEELRKLFGGTLPPRARVRFVRHTGMAVWEVRRA